MSSKNFRSRIYSSYVQARNEPLAPLTPDGLSPRMPYLRRLIRRHFPRNRAAEILDLGCGHGALLFCSKQLGYYKVRGIDHSPEQVEAARQLGIDNVKEGDLLEALNLQPDDSLDAVVAFDVIEHFSREESLDFVDQVLRVLKPGGRWIIHVPNAESPFGSRMRYWDITHEIAFTRTSLAQLLISSGFRSVCCFEDTPAVHGIKSAARWLLWRVLRSIWKLYMAVETGEVSSNHIFSQNLTAVALK